MKTVNFHKVLSKVKYAIFPSDHVCYICGGFCEGKRDMLCNDCSDQFSVEGNVCIKCGRPTLNNICTNCNENSPNYSGGVCAFYYDGKARSSLLSFKSKMHKYRARLYAKCLSEVILDIEWEDAQYVVYVPGSIGRNIKRGYNPSKIIARNLAINLNIACLGSSLKRNNTKRMTKLGRLERMKAVTSMYGYGRNIRKIVGKSVILVDDVMTTGSTLNKCAELLFTAGAKEIRIAYAFARRVIPLDSAT